MNYLENITGINKRMNNKFVEYKNNGDIIIYPDKEGIILKRFGRNNGKSNLQLKILSALIQANLTNKPVTIHCGMVEVDINDIFDD